MRVMITALGLALTLATPAMADMRVEQGVRVHRGSVSAVSDDKAAVHAVRRGPLSSSAEVRRMVRLDRRYGSGSVSRTAMRPLWLVPVRPGGGR